MEQLATQSGLITESLTQRVQDALTEDLGAGDITTASVTKYDRHVHAKIVAKDSGIVSGMDVAMLVYQQLEPHVDLIPKVSDGDQVQNGDSIMFLEGSGRVILEGERTALNFLGRMSGISNMVKKYVRAVSGTGVRILDTRKTMPLWRDIEKYAVRKGGGVNHRMGLYDMILIKENHIEWAGGIENAVQQTIDAQHSVPIEVEIQTLAELDKIISMNVNRVLLDNMTPEDVKKAVGRVDNRFEVEVSGGITLENIRDYAETGVDYISVGALTHSVKAFDVSLLIEE